MTEPVRSNRLTLAGLEREHALLAGRLRDAPDGADAVALWRQLGIKDAAQVADLDAAEVRALMGATA